MLSFNSFVSAIYILLTEPLCVFFGSDNILGRNPTGLTRVFVILVYTVLEYCTFCVSELANAGSESALIH